MASWILGRTVWANRHHHPVIFANSLTEAVVCLPALLVREARCVVWIHNFVVPRAARLTSFVLRRVSPRRMRLAAVSSVASSVGEAVFRRRSTIIPNPIEAPTVSREPSCGYNQAPVRVAYVSGTDRHYKGFDLLPDIIAATEGERIDWLVVASSSTQPDAWFRLDQVTSASGSQTVTVSPREPDPSRFFDWTDIVVIPSREESFCRVAAEAMAAGRAVVASRLPAIVEVCGDSAEYFDVEDTEAAAAMIRSFGHSSESLVQQIERGRRRAERYTPDTIVEKMQAFIGAAA